MTLNGKRDGDGDISHRYAWGLEPIENYRPDMCPEFNPFMRAYTGINESLFNQSYNSAYQEFQSQIS